jgi:hypothetical protein
MGTFIPLSLKELKDRRPENSRTKKVFFVKWKERLLEKVRSRILKLVDC